MSDPIIRLNKLQFRWPGQADNTLDIPTLTVQAGQHLFIKGSSGSGKTTLLNLLTGITSASSGTVDVLGQNLNDLSYTQRDQFRVDHLGVIFQQFNLLPYLSIIDNVQLPCLFSNKRHQAAGDLQASSLRLLHELRLPESLFHQPVSSLSVGQQQRVAVARALIGQPEIIIADEPTSALDTENRDRFLQLLFREAEQQSSTLIFVSHDPQITSQFPEVLVLENLNQAQRQQEEFA